jgi:TonB family protein
LGVSLTTVGDHAVPVAFYPPLARAALQEGSVVLDVILNRTGTLDARVTETSGFSRLDEAASDYVKHLWRNAPPGLDGRGPACRTQVKVIFVLTYAPDG